MKKRSAIIIAIILMSIGFASISTTLIINGNAKVDENEEDFSVIFTAASLDGKDVYASVIDDTKKIINFTTAELNKVGDNSVLTYEVTNNSSQYDAEIKVTCVPKDGTTAKYTSIKNELENDATKVLAKQSLNGKLTVTLDKTSIEEVSEEYTCKLEFNATGRDEYAYTGDNVWNFDYTGGEQVFTAPVTGIYKLEIWGAQGGNSDTTITTKYPAFVNYVGGYGGYSQGELFLKKDDSLYINVGGMGEDGGFKDTRSIGGYNGGGSGGLGARDYWLNTRRETYPITSAGGGGATHVATKSGLLSTLENYKDEIIIVAGGGGGSVPAPVLSGSGGGISGGLGYVYNGTYVNGGSQVSGYAFGQGQMGHDSIQGTNGDAEGSGGGGGGFYGGFSYQGVETASDAAGAGGSGYIGNTLLINKSMYCYNCEESAEESTKTISTTCTSTTPTENCSKQGNGYAQISLIK